MSVMTKGDRPPPPPPPPERPFRPVPRPERPIPGPRKAEIRPAEANEAEKARATGAAAGKVERQGEDVRADFGPQLGQRPAEIARGDFRRPPGKALSIGPGDQGAGKAAAIADQVRGQGENQHSAVGGTDRAVEARALATDASRRPDEAPQRSSDRTSDQKFQPLAIQSPELTRIMLALSQLRASVSPEQFDRFVGENETILFNVLSRYGFQGSRATAEGTLRDFDHAYRNWLSLGDKKESGPALRAPAPEDPRAANLRMLRAAAGDPIAAVWIGVTAAVNETVGRALGLTIDPDRVAAVASMGSLAVQSAGTVGKGRANYPVPEVGSGREHIRRSDTQPEDKRPMSTRNGEGRITGSPSAAESHAVGAHAPDAAGGGGFPLRRAGDGASGELPVFNRPFAREPSRTGSPHGEGPSTSMGASDRPSIAAGSIGVARPEPGIKPASRSKDPRETGTRQRSDPERVSASGRSAETPETSSPGKQTSGDAPRELPVFDRSSASRRGERERSVRDGPDSWRPGAQVRPSGEQPAQQGGGPGHTLPTRREATPDQGTNARSTAGDMQAARRKAAAQSPQDNPSIGGRRLGSVRGNVGASEGGPGKWVWNLTGGENFPPRARSFQEQVSGVSAMKDYKVTHAREANLVADFDGWDQGRKVLQDAKDWNPNNPQGPAGAFRAVLGNSATPTQIKIAEGRLKEFIRFQNIAESHGCSFEIVFSNELALEAVRQSISQAVTSNPQLSDLSKILFRHVAPDPITGAIPLR